MNCRGSGYNALPHGSFTCVAHGQVPALTRYLRVLTFSSTIKMNTFASENGDGKAFVSPAPGYWPDIAPELWNDWRWQLKNRVTTLAQLEKHLELSDEERSGVLLSGDKLALAVTPHFFNLLPVKIRMTRSGVRSSRESRKRGRRLMTWPTPAAKIRTCRCRV